VFGARRSLSDYRKLTQSRHLRNRVNYGILAGMAEIPLRLRELRLARGMTQTQLAERAGVRVGSVSKFERGGTSKTLVLLGKLARALDVPVRELFEHVQPPPKRRRRG
jgi:DNA-binding XRE family transcriptional regulator